jgi:hypothetical protein
MDFKVFQAAVAAQFERMQRQGKLFRTNVDRDGMWNHYLSSFPPGTNPMFRKRTEHDCACCRQFVKAVGNVVAVIDGKLVSIWDTPIPEEPGYAAVAKEMSRFVRSHPIAEPFLHHERKVGSARTFEEVVGGTPTAWDHFSVQLKGQFVANGADIPALLNEHRNDHGVFLRSLKEIKPDAVDTVLDLIAQNSIYRGAEHKATVMAFKEHQDACLPTIPDTYAWTADAPPAVKRIRNTAIGTLLVDLSEGKDLEHAVKAFEAKVAPANYKRPTALVTPAMIAKAKTEVEALGLTSALERRYAMLTDLSINNVLFADRSAKAAINGTVFDELAASAPAVPRNLDKIESVPVEKFLSEILPKAESIEVLFENKHRPNLVSLIAPVDPTAAQLFKWPNKFSWAYNGDMADAIKERVKAAGGNVTGDLCCRLAWSNYDDLDLHLRGPGGMHIYFHNKRDGGGVLDVDMNGLDGRSRTPVENIYFASCGMMREGDYQLYVNQYNVRERVDVGFEAQIDFLGTVYNFAYPQAVRAGEDILIATFKYSRDNGFQIIESLPVTTASKEVWGLPTQRFHRVKAVMLSPNYWDDYAVGNKHYFFMLEGCANDGTARGFFNEFLRGELDAHRKVLEMVGSKMQAGGPNQLSGLGFSSTAKNTLTCRVKGSFSRLINIVF